MTLFGSRDEDPLLQDDPLAPSGPKEDGDPPEDSGGPGRTDEAPTSRLVEYSTSEAASGPLRTLNRAFGQGWRLERIDRNDDRLIFTLRRAGDTSTERMPE